MQWRHEDWRDDTSLSLSALEVEPNSAVVQANAADAWLRQGKAAEAESCARRAVELDSGFARAQELLAASLDFLGRADEAEPAFEKALALDRNERNLLNLARFHANHGRLQRAIELLKSDRVPSPPGPERRALLEDLQRQVASTRP